LPLPNHFILTRHHPVPGNPPYPKEVNTMPISDTTYGTVNALAAASITNGVVTGTATCTLPTAGGSPKGVGLWTASTAGTMADGQYNTTDVTYPGPGTAAITITYTQT
jgi:hypothetical protein